MLPILGENGEAVRRNQVELAVQTGERDEELYQTGWQSAKCCCCFKLLLVVGSGTLVLQTM